MNKNNLTEFVEDNGIKIKTFYGKYMVSSYDEALKKAKDSGFMAGIRIDEKADYGMLFNNKEEFDELIEGKEYPLAIVPLL